MPKRKKKRFISAYVCHTSVQIEIRKIRQKNQQKETIKGVQRVRVPPFLQNTKKTIKQKTTYEKHNTKCA